MHYTCVLSNKDLDQEFDAVAASPPDPDPEDGEESLPFLGTYCKRKGRRRGRGVNTGLQSKLSPSVQYCFLVGVD